MGLRDVLDWLAGTWWLGSIGSFVATVALSLSYRGPRPATGTSSASLPPVSLLVPVAGLDPELEDNLRSMLTQDHPDFEVIISVTGDAEPALPLIRRLLATPEGARGRLILHGNRAPENPKVANLLPAYQAARHDHVLSCDANVALPPDAIRRALRLFAPGIGVVSAIPIAVRPHNFAAELEAAMFNAFSARWLCAGAALGRGFPFGKLLFYRKHELDRAGGLAATGCGHCDDLLLAKALARLGLGVASAGTLVTSPVGERRFIDFWNRQKRWCQCRRSASPLVAIVEPFSTGLSATLAGLAFWTGFHGIPAATVIAATALGWVSIDGAHFALKGWPFSPRAPAAWLAWEILHPIAWCASLGQRRLDWRGHVVDARAA